MVIGVYDSRRLLMKLANGTMLKNARCRKPTERFEVNYTEVKVIFGLEKITAIDFQYIMK